MRIAIAFFGQETSSFSPVLTTLETFKLYGLYEGKEILDKCQNVGPLGGFLKAAENSGIDWAPLPLIHGWAGAHGPITADTLTFFEEKIVAGLKASHPVDAMFFALHGAGAAENALDSEGHLLTAVRRVIGEEVPLVISLDHHANVTRQMMEAVDALVAHRTQPHDPFETGFLAGQLLFARLREEIAPTMAWRKIPLITHQEQFLTSQGPMKTWFDMARKMEAQPGVISVSTFPMQPWLDVPEGGWSAVVVTDNDLPLAERLADALADKAWALRDAFCRQESIPPAAAIRRAIEAERGLVILTDTGDSVFGGAPGDSTCLLREMLRQQITDTALVPLVDPEMVESAIAAGVGQTITRQVGGKLDPAFHQPVELTAKVAGVGGGRFAVPVIGLESFDMGRAVLLEVGSIKLMVSETHGVGGNHPIVYEHFGLNPAQAKMVVLKTASNWQYYQPYLSKIIRADTPGATMSNLAEFDWRHLPRPIYPLDPLASWR